MSRSAYRAGWQRLTFRISGLAATGAGGYYALWENQDSTIATVRDVWENPGPAIAAAQTGGIGLVSATAVGGVAYGLATRKRREFMREWVAPLHKALAVPLGMFGADRPAPLPPCPAQLLRRRRGDTHRRATVRGLCRGLLRVRLLLGVG
ncbi:hypothetical protein AB0H07_40280 [Streptomyces sp. NPDC021354]|uniref:hypothetical protein n=1 Tax=Streptomyces sp. NPDC021354 TaxID=3154793 RepID=UPI003405E6FB